jgi:hypothetical protein
MTWEQILGALTLVVMIFLLLHFSGLVTIFGREPVKLAQCGSTIVGTGVCNVTCDPKTETVQIENGLGCPPKGQKEMKFCCINPDKQKETT